jgi:hypothetical protein
MLVVDADEPSLRKQLKGIPGGLRPGDRLSAEMI